MACFFIELHITLTSFKIRQICVFSNNNNMKTNKNLVLLGMMGSGKSTIGKFLSKKTNYKFIDVDKKIESEKNLSISNIFEKYGENYFRKLEREISIKYIDHENVIIALGGGAFLDEQIRKKVLKNSLSIWLNWNAKTLIKRIKNSKKRPIILSLNENEINELIEQRNKIYSKAQIKIDCDNLKKIEIVNYIIKKYIK